MMALAGNSWRREQFSLYPSQALLLVDYMAWQLTRRRLQKALSLHSYACAAQYADEDCRGLYRSWPVFPNRVAATRETILKA